MNVRTIYQASDAASTKALYAHLESLGGAGVLAVNLLRAQKASARAKVYSRKYSKLAYDKKDWSIEQLCNALTKHNLFGITWGWKEDPAMEPDAPHRWVLYIELPVTPALAKGPAVLAQVSFHNGRRLSGPDYPHEWDRVVGASEGRIIAWAQDLLDATKSRTVTIGYGDFTTRIVPNQYPQRSALDAYAMPLGWSVVGSAIGGAIGKFEPRQDVVCEHGRAMDVHCCGCHSGFLFDSASCTCLDSTTQLDLSLDVNNPQEG